MPTKTASSNRPSNELPDGSCKASPRDDAKLAERVADQIAKRVRDERLPVDTLIGSRDALAVEYGVGEGTIREATRLLENHGIAVSRRGRGGGLIVATAVEDPPYEALLSYIEFLDVRPNDFVDVMVAVARQVLAAAASCKDESKFSELVALVGNMQQPELSLIAFTERFYDVMAHLATMSGNPATGSFLVVLHRLQSETISIDALNDPRGAIEIGLENIKPLLEAIFSGDQGAAQAVVLNSVENYHHVAHEHFVPEAHKPSAFRKYDRAALDAELAASSATTTTASVLARMFLREIRALGWPEGKNLGVEGELAKRYGVSRTVFRSAIRLLERYGVVSTREGKSGGVIVGAPDPTAIIRIMDSYFAVVGFNANQALEARGALEPLVVGALADQRNSVGDLHALRQALTAPHADRAARFYAAMESMIANPLAALFLRIVWDANGFEIDRDVQGEHPLSHVIDAIAARDTAAAQRRIRHYLQVLKETEP